MQRDEVLHILREHMPILREKYHVKYLALFGSVARNEATETSDIDCTVEFDRTASLFTHVGAKLYLEDLFERKVDLVSRNRLKPRIKEQILSEEVVVG